jgi:uncharacterized membrane protein (DUF485 family)
MIGLDAYLVKARLRPALLALLPLTVTILTLDAAGILGWNGMLAAILQAGGGMLLAQYVGDLGKRRERELFIAWGGRPTERFLTHAHAPNQTTRELRHAKIRRLIPNLVVPSAEQERQDFQAAMSVYEVAIDQLRPALRGNALLFAENCHYGFRRNTWALKWHGLTLAALGFLILSATVGGAVASHQRIEPIVVAGAITNGVLLATWTWVVTPVWVRRAADLYAERFLEGLDGLELPSR